jgi:hypothetical protein
MTSPVHTVFCWFFLAELEVKLRASCLLLRCSTTPAHFAFVILRSGLAWCWGLAWTEIFLFMLSVQLGWQTRATIQFLLVEMESHNFFLGWPWTSVLSIPTSQVARITGFRFTPVLRGWTGLLVFPKSSCPPRTWEYDLWWEYSPCWCNQTKIRF